MVPTYCSVQTTGPGMAHDVFYRQPVNLEFLQHTAKQGEKLCKLKTANVFYQTLVEGKSFATSDKRFDVEATFTSYMAAWAKQPQR